MSFSPASLNVLLYANGHTRWHYRTQDTGGQVLHPGYFDKCAKMVRVGDHIDIETASSFGTLVVCANDDRGVVVQIGMSVAKEPGQ